MIYIVIVLLIVLIFLILYLILNNKNNNFDKFKYEIFEIIEDRNSKNSDNISKNFIDIKDNINNMNNMNYGNLIKKISDISNSQKSLETVTQEIVKFQNILNDKKSRGRFGEIRLEEVLENIYGDSKIFERQYKMSNGRIADTIIKLSDKIVAIDSKFPLETYIRYEEDSSLNNRNDFVKSIKKHIDDISNKYIIEGETLNQAIMFLPSESIYLEIYKNFEDIIYYGYKNNVWIASQTNLLIYISTLIYANLEFEKTKESENILNKLISFSEEFVRYKQRWSNLEKDFEKIQKDFRDLSITANKISNKFDDINNLKNR